MKRYMRKYIIKSVFTWDDENDEMFIIVCIPDNKTIDEVREILQKEHDFLCTGEDDECLYENNGRNIESLMSYVCRKYGWDWDSFDPDDEIIFE